MSLRKFGKIKSIFSALALSLLVTGAQAAETIKIGINLPLSGGMKNLGSNSLEGAKIAKDEVNAQGGLLIGDKRYLVEFVEGDNQSNVEVAVREALSQISGENVLGIVGPIISSIAIPVGGISESFKISMISPTSTNPRTTQKRPFVFRACFLDDFQGEVMARFATRDLKAEKAAVLFDFDNAYPKGLAEFFKLSFEKEKGEGSVVFESWESDASDLSQQIARIVESDADVLFVPQYSSELPNIFKQLEAGGWSKPVLGGDAWEASDLLEICGESCKGQYFSSHFAALGAKGMAGDFVKKFNEVNGSTPTAFGGLGYDSAKLLMEAISRIDSFSGNLFIDRAKIKEQMAAIKDFQGVSGVINMNPSGDPLKGAVIIRITDTGEFESYTTVNP